MAGVSLARELRESGGSQASAGSTAQGQSPGKAGGHTGSPEQVRGLDAEDSGPAPSRWAGPAGATPAYPGCRITSSYKAFCRLDRRHFSTCSYFFVSCFSTSLLVLLKMKGCVTCEGDECALRRPMLNPCHHTRCKAQRRGRRTHTPHTYPVQPYDHFVVVVLILVVRGLQGQVQVRPGDAGDEEVYHGPELQEGVVQGRVDQQQALLAEGEHSKRRRCTPGSWPQVCFLRRGSWTGTTGSQSLRERDPQPPCTDPREGKRAAKQQLSVPRTTHTPPSATPRTPSGPRGSDLLRVNTASQCLSVMPRTRCISSMTRQRHRTRVKAA